MKTTVKLQESFSYSKLPIYILGALVILGVLYFVISYIIAKSKNKKKLVVKKVSAPQIEKIKAKHIAELIKIENDFKAKKIDIRIAYQRISACVRKFVNRATGINTQNCTLQEIRTLNMPQLVNLIEEFYKPEFSPKSEGDVSASILKTKRVIEEWK